MDTSTRRGISYPSPDRHDRPDVPLHFKNLVDFLDLDVVYSSGTDAARLASTHYPAGGRLWWATDTHVLWYDDGSSWWSVLSAPARVTALPTTGLVHGLQVELVDDLNNPTYQWNLRYNANRTGNSKWEWVGGRERVIHGGWADLNGHNAVTQVYVTGGFPYRGSWLSTNNAVISNNHSYVRDMYVTLAGTASSDVVQLYNRTSGDNGGSASVSARHETEGIINMSSAGDLYVSSSNPNQVDGGGTWWGSFYDPWIKWRPDVIG